MILSHDFHFHKDFRPRVARSPANTPKWLLCAGHAQWPSKAKQNPSEGPWKPIRSKRYEFSTLPQHSPRLVMSCQQTGRGFRCFASKAFTIALWPSTCAEIRYARGGDEPRTRCPDAIAILASLVGRVVEQHSREKPVFY